MFMVGEGGVLVIDDGDTCSGECILISCSGGSKQERLFASAVFNGFKGT